MRMARLEPRGRESSQGLGMERLSLAAEPNLAVSPQGSRAFHEAHRIECHDSYSAVSTVARQCLVSPGCALKAQTCSGTARLESRLLGRRDGWVGDGWGWCPCRVAHGRPRFKKPERELIDVGEELSFRECRSAERPNPHLIGNRFRVAVPSSLTSLCSHTECTLLCSATPGQALEGEPQKQREADSNTSVRTVFLTSDGRY